jgi:two-component system, NarL family, response regulator NreC
MASSYAVIHTDARQKPVANLSVAIVGEPALRLRCQTILARERIASRSASLADAARLLRRHRPSVLLLDATRWPKRALSALPTLRSVSPQTGVVVLGRRRASTATLLHVVRHGAWGHVAAPDLPRDLAKAVRMVAARQTWLPRRLSAAIVADLVGRAHAEKGIA